MLPKIKKYIPQKIFSTFQPLYHFMLAFLSALWYRFPSRRLVVIGVTGTKGKTTVVELLHRILTEGGYRTASLSSLCVRIKDEIRPNEHSMTMPGRFFIQKLIHEAIHKGCTHVIIETTSQGIMQFRHRFISFDVALVTNVAPEHIEAHGNFERYIRSKLDLFWRLKPSAFAVINRDDPYASRFVVATGAKKIFYGKHGIMIGNKEWNIKHIGACVSGIEFEIQGVLISSLLLGEFNLYNICAAIAIALHEHVAISTIADAVSRVSEIPGRLEYIIREPFRVIVDYAHTPDSLLSIYTLLSSARAGNREKESNERKEKLLCVLGAAGGGRDKWKRREMGKIAAAFCDEAILTNEDSYDEDPEAILSEIEAGFSDGPRQCRIRKILDRRDAIREALLSAQKGDTVIITGKGSEQWIHGPNNQKIPWDDKEIAREELQKLSI